MPRDSDGVPVKEVAVIVVALCENLLGALSHALHCSRTALSAGVFSCTYHHLNLASVGNTVSCLFLIGVCIAFYSSGLVLTTCLLLPVGFPETDVLQEPTGYTRTVVGLTSHS